MIITHGLALDFWLDRSINSVGMRVASLEEEEEEKRSELTSSATF